MARQAWLRGHWRTKSRRYPTTWTARQYSHDLFASTRTKRSPSLSWVLRKWAYRGAGWQTPGEAALATAIAAYTREQRRTARIARTTA